MERSLIIEIGSPFPEVEFEIWLSSGHAIALTDGSTLCLDSFVLFVLFPWKDGGIGFDVILAEKKISRDSWGGVEREIISIFEIVGDICFLICVDDGIDIIEIEGELTHWIKEGLDVGWVEAGGVGKIWIISWTSVYFYLGEFEQIWSIFSLHF